MKRLLLMLSVLVLCAGTVWAQCCPSGMCAVGEDGVVWRPVVPLLPQLRPNTVRTTVVTTTPAPQVVAEEVEAEPTVRPTVVRTTRTVVRSGRLFPRLFPRLAQWRANRPRLFFGYRY